MATTTDIDIRKQIIANAHFCTLSCQTNYVYKASQRAKIFPHVLRSRGSVITLKFPTTSVKKKNIAVASPPPILLFI
jgi:hypothetical protein